MSKESATKAREFVLNAARPLEKALYGYHFQDGAMEAVLHELGKFQNPDGGFGRALEPDLRATESSALCAAIALEILAEIGAPASTPLLRPCVDYLLRTFDRKTAAWRIIPAAAEQSPHAPWWNQGGLREPFEKSWDHFLANPRAKICAYLFHYQELAPTSFLDDLLGSVLVHLESEPDRVSGDTLRCYLCLYEARNLPPEAGTRMRRKLERMVSCSVETDPSKWGSYCLKPLWTVKTPDSPFYPLIRQDVEKNLDYEIARQCEDGSWKPFWSWGNAYPADWVVAEKEWRGILTLDILRVMNAFGRLG